MILVSQLLDLACRLGGPRFAFRVHLRRMQRWGTFEPEYFLLDRLVNPTRAAVDVGGNEGYYAGRLAQLCPRVHSFEPIPWLAESLRRKLARTVTVHEYALSNQRGTAILRIPYRGDVELHGSATLDEHNPLEDHIGVRTVTCKLERLDDVLREPVGFIKIDVEGHELPVLKGADELLRRDSPVLLIESEFRHNPEAPGHIFRHLGERGYEGFFLDRGRMCSVASFEMATHQQVANLKGREGPYINNFVFSKQPFPTGLAALLAGKKGDPPSSP